MRFKLTSLLLTLAVALSAANAPPAETVEGLPGLRQRLEIVRDREGVPHIRAGSEADAVFGLGFMHAQDRLWQLEFLRRVGSGRLSEILGPRSLDGDKLFRTLGVAQSAAATWAHYAAHERQLVGAYVAGLNAGTDRQRANLPLEFTLLGATPEPWRPEDVLVMAKVLGWSVDSNWTHELLRAQLAQKLGPERAAWLTPPFAKDDPIILPKDAGATPKAANRNRRAPGPRLPDALLSGLIALERRIASETGRGGEGSGSNNQVLSGVRTASGHPLLASDPHLPSQLPSIFYRVHLTGGGLNVIGTTAVGIPGVLMGHNDRVAWGWTNAMTDVQDLYLERIRDGAAEFDGRLEPLRLRQETIRVKGAADVALSVRATRHGPLISDLIDPTGPALSLQWATLDSDDDIGVAANLEMNKANNWAEFTAAFRHFKAHGQNLVFADTAGNIAYLMAGVIPVRASGDGSVPSPGWTSAYGWTGYVPFDELPFAFNPRQGYLSSANNRIAPDTYRHNLGTSFAAPYRAARIVELIEAKPRQSAADLERMQADVFARHAHELLPVLANVSPLDARARDAITLLRNWDLRVTADSPAAAIFEAWLTQLAESIFADELGDALWRSYSDNLNMLGIVLPATIREQPAWCDDVTTLARESCAATALTALNLALDRMTAVQGSADLRSWQWGKAHRLVFFHQPFDGDPALSQIFNRVAPSGGDRYTLNVASNPRWREYDQRHLALYRQIIDLDDFGNSRWMAAPGQSGELFSPYYDDRIGEWLRVEYRPMLFTETAIDGQAAERIVLQP